MQIEPFGERVAIRVINSEEVSSGGLIIATNNNNSNRGEIVALGNSADDFFQIGDRVIFSKGAGVDYKDGTENYKIINTKDVLCKYVG